MKRRVESVIAKLQNMHSDSNFIYFRIEEPVKEQIQFDWRNEWNYREINEDKEQPCKSSNQKMNWISMMDWLRENDLLLFSKQKITGIYDLFDLSSNEKAERFFDILRPKEGKFLSIVDRKRKNNETGISMKTGFTLKNDLMMIIQQLRKVEPIFYCYYLTSLSTILREFKALNAIEYSPYIKAILDPARWLNKQITLNNSISSDYSYWQEFLNSNESKFNESQVMALRQVCELKRQEMLLIQGPVSSYLFSLKILHHHNLSNSNFETSK